MMIIFLAVDNILNKISSKDFLRSNPKNIHLTSDDHTKRRGGIHIQPLQPYHKKILIYFTVVANIRINTKNALHTVHFLT